MTRPLIAVTGETGVLSWMIWKDVKVSRVAFAYLDKIIDAGGVPVVVPAVPEVIEDAIARVDGLLLTGGADIHPRRYGAEPEIQVMPFEEERDEADFRALDVALRRGLPVLGLCRGLQVISIARGGTLHQHLPEHAPTQVGRYDVHELEVKPDSVLGATLGPGVGLSCHHHQGVDRPGDGLVPTAWAADGVIEGLEDPALPFLVGVQSHPEVDRDTGRLFEAFVAAAGGQVRTARG